MSYQVTIQALAKQAIDVQNACNLSGVVHSFSRAMSALRELEPGKDTNYYNLHPIMCMYASQIHNICQMGLSDTLAYQQAYDACKTIAKG